MSWAPYLYHKCRLLALTQILDYGVTDSKKYNEELVTVVKYFTVQAQGGWNQEKTFLGSIHKISYDNLKTI